MQPCIVKYKLRATGHFWGKSTLVALLALFLFPEASLSTTYIYESYSPPNASDEYPRNYNDYSGYLDYIKFVYSDTSKIFSMKATFDNNFAPTEGFRLTLTNGPMPSTRNDAVNLFVHEDKNNPGTALGTIYDYSKVTFTEHLQSKLLVSKDEFSDISQTSVTRENNQITYELSIDTSAVENYFNGPVLSFDEEIGIWFPWFTNIVPEYDSNGRLISWYAPGTTHSTGRGTQYSMLDTKSALRTEIFEDPPTEVPEPASLALLLSGLIGAKVRRNKKS